MNPAYSPFKNFLLHRILVSNWKFTLKKELNYSCHAYITGIFLTSCWLSFQVQFGLPQKWKLWVMIVNDLFHFFLGISIPANMVMPYRFNRPNPLVAVKICLNIGFFELCLINIVLYIFFHFQFLSKHLLPILVSLQVGYGGGIIRHGIRNRYLQLLTIL